MGCLVELFTGAGGAGGLGAGGGTGLALLRGATDGLGAVYVELIMVNTVGQYI